MQPHKRIKKAEKDRKGRRTHCVLLELSVSIEAAFKIAAQSRAIET